MSPHRRRRGKRPYKHATHGLRCRSPLGKAARPRPIPRDSSPPHGRRTVIRIGGLPAQIRFGGKRNVALDTGDIAWVIAATALVMIMTPAVGFFYRGTVRGKNPGFTIRQ